MVLQSPIVVKRKKKNHLSDNYKQTKYVFEMIILWTYNEISILKQ